MHLYISIFICFALVFVFVFVFAIVFAFAYAFAFESLQSKLYMECLQNLMNSCFSKWLLSKIVI